MEVSYWSATASRRKKKAKAKSNCINYRKTIGNSLFMQNLVGLVFDILTTEIRRMGEEQYN